MTGLTKKKQADTFYTLGLPRTRSAWLTQLLRTRYTDCYHDILSLFGGNNQLPESTNMYVGSCDTNPLNEVKRNKLLIVDRNKNEVINDMINSFDNPFDDLEFKPFIEGLINRMEIVLNTYKNCIRIKFDDLDDYKNLVDVCRYLKPKEPINEYHIRIMMETIVVVKPRNIKPAITSMKKHYGMNEKELYNYFVGVKCQ